MFTEQEYIYYSTAEQSKDSNVLNISCYTSYRGNIDFALQWYDADGQILLQGGEHDYTVYNESIFNSSSFNSLSKYRLYRKHMSQPNDDSKYFCKHANASTDCTSNGRFKFITLNDSVQTI